MKESFMDIYELELCEPEYIILKSVAKSYGLSVRDFISALCYWIDEPKNREKAIAFLGEAMQEDIQTVKRRKYERLLTSGWDPEYAAYFADGIKRAVTVEPSDNYTIIITFDNGERRRLDCKGLMTGRGAFLQDEETFRRVRMAGIGVIAWDIDPNVDSNIVWENVFDICPDDAYVCSVPLEQGEI